VKDLALTDADGFLALLAVRAQEELSALEPNRVDLRDKLEVYLNEVPVALDLLARMGPNRATSA